MLIHSPTLPYKLYAVVNLSTLALHIRCLMCNNVRHKTLLYTALQAKQDEISKLRKSFDRRSAR
jgi:hypothetical protein